MTVSRTPPLFHCHHQLFSSLTQADMQVPLSLHHIPSSYPILFSEKPDKTTPNPSALSVVFCVFSFSGHLLTGVTSLSNQECSVLREPAVNQIWRPLPAKQALTVLQDRHQPRLPALPPHTTLPLVEMRSLTAWTVPRDLSVLVGKQHPTGSVLQDIFAPARVTRQPRTLVLRATIGMSLVGKVLVVAQCARVDS